MVNLANTDKKYLVIGTCNVDELYRGKLELEVFLEARDISILMVTETHLEEGETIRVRGFQVFRKDRNSKRGGVAVLVRNDLQARQVKLDFPLETVGIEVVIMGNRHRFISLYIPPSRSFSEEEIRGLLVGPRIVIGDDLNAKNSSWGCRRTDKRGKVLGEVIRGTKVLEVFAPTVATLIPPGRNSRGNVLDIFVAFRAPAPWDVRTQFALNSDHFPVTTRIGGDPAKAKQVFRVDWNRFRDRTEQLGLGKEPVRKGRLSEIASDFKEVQEALKDCSTEMPPRQRNHLGLTSEEKEVINLKERVE